MSVHTRGERLCFVTSAHLAANPRLVKEFSAALEAGYQVSVVFSQYVRELVDHDASIMSRYPAVNYAPVRWTTDTLPRKLRCIVSGVRSRSAQWLFRTVPLPGMAEMALGRLYPELARKAQAVPADLYIAHNLAALPAAAKAAVLHDARLGFDAEDFHRGELNDTPENQATLRLVRDLEARYMPRCDYLTAASDGIAEAYARALGVSRPTTILNVFPRADRIGHTPTAVLQREKAVGVRSLYWFSQTIGGDRGLQDVLEALPLLESDVHLYLRGKWAAGFRDAFMRRAEVLKVDHRVHHLSLVPPGQLIELASRHDIGLALELGHTPNRRLCVTNKLFTYLLAGLPVIATATDGQRPFCEMLPSATWLYPVGNPAMLARTVQSLLGDEQKLQEARRAAWQAGDERYNWDRERGVFLQVVDLCLHDGRPWRFH